MTNTSADTAQVTVSPLQAFRGAYRAAVEAAGAVVSMSFRLGPESVALQFAGPALRREIGRPFEHLPAANGSPTLTIRVWDTESTGIPLPAEVPAPSSVYVKSMPSLSESSGVRWAYFRPDPGLTAYESAVREADYWVPAASRLTYGDVAGGFRAVIAWAMAERSMHFLHSAAVATGGKAALIVGPSGSGKSSTALACLLEGFEYLGDDHCLLDMTGVPTVHSVYAAAKVRDSQLARFPELEPLIVNPSRPETDKAVCILYPELWQQLPASRPVVTVLVPRITMSERTTVERISAAEALMALAPSTLLQMAAADRSGLSAMGRLVRDVPCFRLNLGMDRKEISNAVATLVQSLGPAR